MPHTLSEPQLKCQNPSLIGYHNSHTLPNSHAEAPASSIYTYKQLSIDTHIQLCIYTSYSSAFIHTYSSAFIHTYSSAFIHTYSSAFTDTNIAMRFSRHRETIIIIMSISTPLNYSSKRLTVTIGGRDRHWQERWPSWLSARHCGDHQGQDKVLRQFVCAKNWLQKSTAAETWCVNIPTKSVCLPEYLWYLLCSFCLSKLCNRYHRKLVCSKTTRSKIQTIHKMIQFM